MKLKRQIGLLIFGFVLMVLGCQRDIDVFVPDNTIIGQVLNPDPVQASVSGTIIDENDQPVEGAIIRAGSQTATTDNAGWFRFNNISLDKYASVVTATKNGYFKGVRTFSAAEGSVNFIKIKLLPKTLIGTIQASAGGTVTLSNGGTISLPANSVVLASIASQPYTGEVKVFAAVIDPTSPDISEILPGSFQATDTNNFRVLMKSYGMMAVQLETPAGELLQVANGKSAALKFIIPSSLVSTAPSTIPLWFLNETDGLWKQEGQAVKTGDHYEGTVSHFSFWNCDVSANMVFVEMNVLSNGQPVQYTSIRIGRLINNMQTNGFTDSSGYVSGFVFSNEILSLEVLNDCYEVIHSQQIGPFAANTNLGTINVTIPPIFDFNVSGSAVDCNNNPVADGSARISWQGRQFFTPITNGNFSLDINMCSATTGMVYIQLVNNANYQMSNLIQANPASGSVNTGSITVCTINSQEFVALTIGTNQDVFSAPADSLLYYPDGGAANIGINAVHSQNGNSVNFIIDPQNPVLIGTGTSQNLLGFTATTVQGQSYPIDTILVNITEYGGVTEYVAGNFSGLLVTNGGVPQQFTCTFRIRRQF